jgi:hypothetical protein
VKITAMSRLAMLDREVAQRVGDPIAAVDRVLDVLDDLLLLEELLGVDPGSWNSALKVFRKTVSASFSSTRTTRPAARMPA